MRLPWASLTVLLLVCAAPAAFAQEPATGAIEGQVFDKETGKPIAGASVTLSGTEQVEVTGADGNFRFAAVPAGSHALGYAKSGYADGRRPDVAVVPNATARADLALEPLAEGESAGLYDVEEFVVVASPVDMESLLLRVTSDELLNVLSAEELSKFAAGDVAEGLKRVAGVNVVEGQFAVIRGLEDRYSSTTYNSAPVPSPDPDTQSVQLDLFPSDVVSNLVVAKTFAPESPSNSSGGSIDIVTHDYAEGLELKLGGGGGFNDNAWDEFLELRSGNPMGSPTDGNDALENELGGSLGGRVELFDRQLRYKAAYNWEVDYETAEGFQQSLEPRPTRRSVISGVLESGGLSLGELELSGGHFDLTESERAEQRTTYLGLGFDVDEAANHRIDASYFFTRKQQEQVQRKDDGYFPGFDYGPLIQKQVNGDEVRPSEDFPDATVTSWIAQSVRSNSGDAPSRGPLWFTSFAESEAFERDRDLRLFQLNGNHQLGWLDGLSLSWAANNVETTQDESARGARYFFEPADTAQIPGRFPATAEALGAGRFAVNEGIFSNDNAIDEKQYFGRLDTDYETTFFGERIALKLSSGLWWERAKRDIDSQFLQSPRTTSGGQFAILGRSELELGENIFDELAHDPGGELAGTSATTSDAKRQIKAWSLGSKATLWQDFDVLAGVRLESIEIRSNNDPFTGENAFDGSPAIFPTKYLFFDRLDNPARIEVSAAPPPGTTYNDQLLGVDVPVDPATGFVDLETRQEIESFANGEIDERRSLPAFGLAYRPLAGLSLRGAYSQTVARPSFREMGYYVTVDPGTDDLFIGNPQLQLSDVESFDARVEYTWGDFGDLVALSAFTKDIEDPIESIVIRDPQNFEASSTALYRTFFNNPSQAQLRGIEVEARKNLGLPGLDFLESFSLGANYTYIDAEVERSEIELARSRAYFGTAPGDVARFSELEKSRRLFGQPEWIANADLTFDQPDWGTKATLAYFAISDVLDAAGSASINPDGTVRALTLDQYIDSYEQLDLVVSQTFHVEFLRGDLILKVAAKNLTDSKRRIIYDPDQTRGEIPEREFRIGRDFSFSLTYSY